MAAPLPFTPDVIQGVGVRLFHSVWQAFLTYACLRVVLLLGPQDSAGTKYDRSYVSLAGIFAWFAVTLWEQLKTVRQIQLAARQMVETGVRQVSLEMPAIYQSQEQLTGLFPSLEMWFPLLVGLYVTGVAVMV